MFDHEAWVLTCGSHVVFEATSILADREKSQRVILVKRVAEADGGDLHGVRHDLAVELPAELTIRVTVLVILLEETHTVVGVTGSEVLAVGGHDQLLDDVQSGSVSYT